MTSTATAGYNIGFNQSVGGTYLNTRLYTKKVSATTFNFGIFKSNRVYYSNNIYNINTTYLVVLKYSFIIGADNDSAKMFVFNSGVPVTEPAVPTAFLKDNVDIQNIGFVFLSNSYAQSGSLKSSSVKIDGNRIGKNWATIILSSINLISDIIPDDFSLSQNYPNPFNPSTKLGFKIPEAWNVKLQVFDVSGKLVSILANERLSHGEYSYNFRGENLPSGTYFYKLDFNSNYRSTGKILKMTLVK